ncbi:MAG TPA: cobyrinate a,c-diamide synthase [Thiothrix sp.]|nr:cobyrinate a,c-diamide synthase [Thiothrix sp.]
MAAQDTPIAHCPAVFLAAPASGQGKTTITAGLARYFVRQGKQVRVFKMGPDYLDPQILAQAADSPVEPLDLWMADRAYCQQQLYLAALEADLILVEGAMGLFDGTPSSADVAEAFNLPVVVVLDVKGMAQTTAALALGLAQYRPTIKTLGFIANRCGSARHAQLIEDAFPADLNLIGSLKRDDAVSLPQRHLGLVQASEQRDQLEQQLDKACAWLAESKIPEKLVSLLTPVAFPVGFGFFRLRSRTDAQPTSSLPERLVLSETEASQKKQNIGFGYAQPTSSALPERSRREQRWKTLSGIKIAIAQDAAFSFIYAANLRLLRSLGATLSFFSPLNDEKLPTADAIWLPGGYPELHAEQLSQNHAMLKALRDFHAEGHAIVAECGGFLYCLESLTDLQQQSFPMLALLAGHGVMRSKRGCQGMQTAVFPEGDIRGHAHHHSRSHDTPTPIAYGRRQNHPANGEAIYRQGSLTASYLHLFFPSNPQAVAQLFTLRAE